MLLLRYTPHSGHFRDLFLLIAPHDGHCIPSCLRKGTGLSRNRWPRTKVQSGSCASGRHPIRNYFKWSTRKYKRRWSCWSGGRQVGKRRWRSKISTRVYDLRTRHPYRATIRVRHPHPIANRAAQPDLLGGKGNRQVHGQNPLTGLQEPRVPQFPR